MTRLKKRKKKKTLTKKVAVVIIAIGTVEGTIPYILSFLNKDPVTEVAVAWITSVVAVALGYFVRGYKDSKSIAEYEKWRFENENITERDISD